MREKTAMDLEFEEHEREQFCEQVRICSELTDEQRLAIFVADCDALSRFEIPLEIQERARRLFDIERDALFTRLSEALG